MLVFRITLKEYANILYAGGGIGRWNPEGNKVLYTAGNISLAVLENMCHRQGAGFNGNFCTMAIEFPDELATTTFLVEDLPKGWNNTDWTDPDMYSVSHSIGDQWYRESKTAVLKVPSVIVPEEFNFVFNSMHPDFSKVKLVLVTKYVPDERLNDLLKKYPK